MPGMMDTVLNLGLNDSTVAALAKKSLDRRFAYDSYRRFITMYADVVLGLGHEHFEELLDEHKERNGYALDTELEAHDWQELVARFKERVEAESGAPFPQQRIRLAARCSVWSWCRTGSPDCPARQCLRRWHCRRRTAGIYYPVKRQST